MPIKNYVCNSLISGVNALKNIETSKAVFASDGDRAFVVDSGQYYYFLFDADGTNAEELVNHPFIVRPDYFVDSGIWVEQSIISTDLMAILVEIYNDMAKESKQLPDNHQVTVSNPTDVSSLATEATLQQIRDKEPENPSLSLSYNNGQLVTISKVVDGVTYLKTLSYTNGVLTAISQWEAQ